MDNVNPAAVVAGIFTAFVCWYLITRCSRAASSTSDATRRVSHGNTPLVWMRRVDGESNWAPLADHDAADVAEVDNAYNGVMCGKIVPDRNPYSVTLSSGRKLSFDWRSDPSSLTNAISNIRYIGKRQHSSLEMR